MEIKQQTHASTRERPFDRVLAGVPGGRYITSVDWRTDEQHIVSFVSLGIDSPLVTAIESEFPAHEGHVSHYAVVPVLVVELLTADAEAESGDTTDIYNLLYESPQLNDLRSLPVAQMLELLAWADHEYNTYDLAATCDIASDLARVANSTRVSIDVVKEFARGLHVGPGEQDWDDTITSVINFGFNEPVSC